MVCNTLIGFNFGDGHLHDEDLIEAVQDEARFEPGELIVVWVESQPIHRRIQHYKVIDAGTWRDRARHLECRGRGRGTAVAAQRAHPAQRDLDPAVDPAGPTGRTRCGMLISHDALA